jgi:hypothetical protein
MKTNRRDMVKLISVGGAGLALGAGCSGEREASQSSRQQQFNMHGYAAPKLETVRVGITGLGSRGSGTVERLARIEGVEIRRWRERSNR